MLKKTLVSITILVLILALASINAVAQSGSAKGGRPTATPPPSEPPVPTETPDTGSLYGDLYIILRDENGLPILDANGCIQPISSMDGYVAIDIGDGTFIEIYAYAGEPFSLAYYTTSDGDLVECELTEEMATWVQSVDFGRLNLGRAPDAVVAHAFDEAINKMNAATGFDIDPAGRLMLLLDDEWFTIDAPAENLALYIKMMKDGHWITLDTTPVDHGGGGSGGGKGNGGGPPPGDGPSTEPRPVLSDTAIGLLASIGYANLGNVDNVLNNHDLLLAASLLAAASDKTGTITLDEVIYINAIYGIVNFDFSIPYEGNPYLQDRARTYGNRSSGGCSKGNIWVLQPVVNRENYYVAECVSIMGKVHFNDYFEVYTIPEDMEFDYVDNVRGFAQSADDALQVLEYIHNYKVPEDIYAE